MGQKKDLCFFIIVRRCLHIIRGVQVSSARGGEKNAPKIDRVEEAFLDISSLFRACKFK